MHDNEFFKKDEGDPMRKKTYTLLVTGLIVLLITACAPPPQDTSPDVTDEEKVAPNDTIVRVNDVEIKGELYNSLYSQLKSELSYNEMDTSNHEELKEMTFTIIIEQELLRQKLIDEGETITDDEVEALIHEIRSEIGDAQFDDFLNQHDITEDIYKQQLVYEVSRQKYIDRYLPEYTVTEKEITDFYTRYRRSQGRDAPPLSEIRDDIEMTLIEQKRIEDLSEEIEVLSEDADIETF